MMVLEYRWFHRLIVEVRMIGSIKDFDAIEYDCVGLLNGAEDRKD